MEASEREWFVEQVGLAAEADGFSRIAGRLWGFLLLAESPCSLDDIADGLGVSKASVSTDARRLREHGVIERVGMPGDRRDYYRIAPDFFGRLMAYRLSRWAGLHALVGTACDRFACGSPAVRDRLDSMNSAHQFMLDRVRAALAEWEAARKGAPTSQPARGSARPARAP